MLPYGLILHRIVDPAIGSPIQSLLRTGGPPMLQNLTVATRFYQAMVGGRRISTPWFSGAMGTHVNTDGEPELQPMDEEEYDNFWKTIETRVPKDRMMNWDMQKHTFE